MAPSKTCTGSKGKGKARDKPITMTTRQFDNGVAQHTLNFGRNSGYLYFKCGWHVHQFLIDGASQQPVPSTSSQHLPHITTRPPQASRRIVTVEEVDDEDTGPVTHLTQHQIHRRPICHQIMIRILPHHLRHMKILQTKFSILRHPLQGPIHLTHHAHIYHQLPIHHAHRTHRLLEGITDVVTIHHELAIIVLDGPRAQLGIRKSTRPLTFGPSSPRKGTNTSATSACTSLNFLLY